MSTLRTWGDDRRSGGHSCHTPLPHPIPYQGSKRALAPLIAPYVPADIHTWFEPFAGSAAMTLWAASRDTAHRYVLAELLEPMGALWRAIIHHPHTTAARYDALW